MFQEYYFHVNMKKQYFSECLWPCTWLHLNHCYRHSWKFLKSKEHTSQAVQHFHILLNAEIRSCSPGPRSLRTHWPWLSSAHFILALVHCVPTWQASYSLLTMQKSCSHLCSHVHMFTCSHVFTPVVPMPGMLLLHGAMSFYCLLKCDHCREVWLLSSILASGTTLLFLNPLLFFRTHKHTLVICL